MGDRTLPACLVPDRLCSELQPHEEFVLRARYGIGMPVLDDKTIARRLAVDDAEVWLIEAEALELLGLLVVLYPCRVGRACRALAELDSCDSDGGLCAC
jgi:hypothetical protein